jgi:hypothetical protein
MLKNNQIKKILFIITLFFLISFLSQSKLIVFAETSGGGCETSSVGCETSSGGNETSGGGCEFSSGGCEKVVLDNPIIGKAGHTAPAAFFSRIITGMLGVVGTLSLVVFIYGGILWLSSKGNPEQVQKGKDVFIYALIGMAVTFSSYAILNLVLTALTGS